jgi:hypothetical protein
MSPFLALTDRERTVWDAWLAHRPEVETAASLGQSERTVRRLRDALRTKLVVHTLGEDIAEDPSGHVHRSAKQGVQFAGKPRTSPDGETRD